MGQLAYSGLAGKSSARRRRSPDIRAASALDAVPTWTKDDDFVIPRRTIDWPLAAMVGSLVFAVASAGDRVRGVQILRNVLRRHADDRETLSRLASFQAALGHLEQALTCAKRLAELEPQYPDLQNP